MQFSKVFLLIILLLLTRESFARTKKSRSSKTRSRPNNSGSSGGRTSTNNGNSDTSSSNSYSGNSYNSYPSSNSYGTKQQYSSGNNQNQKVSDTKSFPTVESQYNRKQTSQYQQSAVNQQNSPIGWNVPAGQGSNNYVKKDTSAVNAQRNPVWNSPSNSGKQQNAPGVGWNSPGLPGNNYAKKDTKVANSQANFPSKGWASGYQSQGPKRDEGLVKKQTAGVQQSNPHQAQPPQPGWNVGGQNNAPNANSGWKSGYQTNGAPPAYPHHNAAPPGYNGQTSWGAPPAYPGHGAPGGYNGFGHQQPSGYGGYGGHGGGYGGYGGGGYGGGYHPQQSMGGYNPGYGGMSMGGHGGGFGGGGFGGGGFGSPSFGGGAYPMQKKSFFSASTIGSVVAGMLVYNMASSLISHGLGQKRPYNVVNYYNQEPGKPAEEIKLPANVLTLCDANVNQMCGQGTQSVCTQNGTVLCVATMNQATPCDQGGNSALCINTTVPCADANDPLCQNSTQKDKLQAEVNVPCFTNLTLDVNLVDKDKTLPNTKYTYCVTTMAVAGPDYKLCEELKNTNDYRSVLNGNHEWLLETDGFKRNYSVYNFEKPMESNGEINMPVTVLVKCTDQAKNLCPPGAIATCTSFNEVMCMASTKDVHECAEKNTTCLKSSIPCPEESKDSFCESKTEGAEKIDLDIPCFANVTFNAPFPKFELAEFNGTLPDLTATSSYTYNFHYCVMTLALPGSDFDLCITKEAKEKQEKGQT